MNTSSLYIHVPLCLKKCDYCDFFSVASGAYTTGDIVAALGREIDARATTSGIDRWNTVYIGGGTPSLLSPRDIATLATHIKTIQSCEWTIEANPEDITVNWLDACTEAGINRLSLGIQTLHENSMISVGRRGSRKASLAALDLVQRCWKGRLSVDLITGLPFQTDEILAESIDTLIQFSPDHVSLYSLTVEEGTPLARRLHRSTPDLGTIPDEDVSAELWIAGRDMLESRGYYQYEVSNFAKPGFESAHNMVYWNLGSWVGCGPGASGSEVVEDRCRRSTNRTDIGAWLRDPAQCFDIEDISREDTIRETILMGMRLRKGINKNAFTARFGTDILDVIGTTTKKWQMRGLLEASSTHLALTKEGLLNLNAFLCDCLDEF